MAKLGALVTRRPGPGLQARQCPHPAGCQPAGPRALLLMPTRNVKWTAGGGKLSPGRCARFVPARGVHRGLGGSGGPWLYPAQADATSKHQTRAGGEVRQVPLEGCCMLAS
jgi:hypothetical protein